MNKLQLHNQKQAKSRIAKAQKCRAMLESGLSVAEIAKKNRVTRQRVYYLLGTLK